MQDSSRTFTSRHGQLTVGSTGVQIKRTTMQQLRSGVRNQREQFIPYSQLAKVHHQHAGLTGGSLKFSLRHDAAGAQPMTRFPKLSFESRRSHQFRQAQRLIEEQIIRASAPQQPIDHQQGQPQQPLVNRVGKTVI